MKTKIQNTNSLRQLMNEVISEKNLSNRFNTVNNRTLSLDERQ